MSYRSFTDRDGNKWEVRDKYSSEWLLVPTAGNPAAEIRIRAPSYQSDPFELSTEELQRLLDEASGGGRPTRPSPFKD